MIPNGPFLIEAVLRSDSRQALAFFNCVIEPHDYFVRCLAELQENPDMDLSYPQGLDLSNADGLVPELVHPHFWGSSSLSLQIAGIRGKRHEPTPEKFHAGRRVV